jgi:N utilization substance protein B
VKFKTPKQKSRERAVQALYQFFISGDDIVDIEKQFLEQKKTKISKTFFTLLLRGSVKEKVELEKLISEFSERKLDEIAPVEKAILYVGLFELKNVLQTPLKVVLNEAVEIAKLFGADGSFKYINSALDSAAKKLRKAGV